MDFYKIREREGQKKGTLDVYLDFQVHRSKDLMVRGKDFYGVWDEKAGLWSRDAYDVQRLVDEELRAYEVRTPGLFDISKKFMGNFTTHSWSQFQNYLANLKDNFRQLDGKLTFADTKVTKEDYVSRRLSYSLQEGDHSAWDEILSTLYEPEERAKIEWFFGAIVSGDTATIQKLLVFYGPPGKGKSTIINIACLLFDGYWETFDARALTSANNSFAAETFKSNPLVVVDHDTDLSQIRDYSKLNSISAHEWMTMNEKGKPMYSFKPIAMPMLGTNKPVKISDAQAGIIRRMIDVQPTGKLIPPRKYQALMGQVEFQLGAIAYHCREVYLEMGKHYYENYKPLEMMLQTDVYFNFMEEHFDLFKMQDGVTLTQAYKLYQQFCLDSGIETKAPRHKLRDELKQYFEHFEERAASPLPDGTRPRSWFSGFKEEKFSIQKPEEHQVALVMDQTESLLDVRYKDCPAQYANSHGTPIKYWRKKTVMRFDPELGEKVEMELSDDQVVNTKLKDLDTQQLHYTKPIEGDIMIDFDIKDSFGQKSFELNLEAASKWPPTYAEVSQGGNGIHLIYEYVGDLSQLSPIYGEGIEIKVFTGDTSMRRRVLKCNNVPVARLEGGLPLKEKKSMEAGSQIRSERGLREMIVRNMRKEFHPGTKPSMDFIHKILEDAYMSGIQYDVTDMRPRVVNFAAMSTNQSEYCLDLVQKMRWHSEVEVPETLKQASEPRLAFFDTEVFPNLFVICWKFRDKIDSFGKKVKQSTVALINPTPQQVDEVLSLDLVGYNCRRYDNHIMYAASMGYTNKQLYELSKKLVSGNQHGFFGSAYNLSYADIYDFSSIKQGLKQFQIDLGLKHKELGLPWDEPVDEKMIPKVVEYCINDVETEEDVFEDRYQDFIARQILSELSGLPVNSTTQQHTSRIVFGGNSRPQEEFVYTDLSEQFPGYEFNGGKSTYNGEPTGEGGYVWAKPGMYENVLLLDVTSMHPTSIEQLNLFGKYTKNFSALLEARIAIKNKQFEKAKGLLDGKLAKYLGTEDEAEALSYALKIVANIVYGLTAARFDNAFKDPRNIDNIVAKRGALFMVDLRIAVQSMGWEVVHIKTDSIKIACSKEQEDEIKAFVMEFGKKYGYNFEHEATYSKMLLVNDAVYVAKVGWAAKAYKIGTWTATGKQFQEPVVFKTLFSNEPLTFRDLCEERSVTSSMWLDFSDEKEDTPMAFADNVDKRYFIGRTGLFCPILPGYGGGLLMREKDGKFYAVTDTAHYRWLEADMVKDAGIEDYIDKSYFDNKVLKALDQIAKYGDSEWFRS